MREGTMYQITENANGKKIIIVDKQDFRTMFMEDPDGTDYQQYLAWVAEGNEPKSATV